ncbi:MAG: hypothetical protein R3E91_01305 [Chlamydiales bacterium]
MSKLLEQIFQISICLKEDDARINEIALFQPLTQKTCFDEESEAIHQRKWSYVHDLSFSSRLTLKIQSFLLKKMPFLIASKRLTNEAKYKTVLAILLSQDSLRDFFFSNEEKKENFFKAAKKAALEIGYIDFIPSSASDPLKISQELTLISGKDKSLIDDLSELNLQIAALGIQERNEILFLILNQLERPPILSILEVIHKNETEAFRLITKYAKYKIEKIDSNTGRIEYHYLENQTTSSIRTRENCLPGFKGVMNQRYAFNAETGEYIGSYSGALNLVNHIIEQILFILNVQDEEVYLIDSHPNADPKTILFTSLLSWQEIELIGDQNKAIYHLNRKVLKIGKEGYIKLKLIHMNISFDAWNKYPIPPEIGATIRDLNDQALIEIFVDLWQQLNLQSEQLAHLKKKIDFLTHEKDFLKYHEAMFKLIDSFRELKPELIKTLEQYPEQDCIRAGIALLKNQKPDGKTLQGADKLLYLNVLTFYLDYKHNKNCKNSINRSAGANAIDKAQHVYLKITQHHFLPDYANTQEIAFFKVLYSMYLIWEEPEINAALSRGFIGKSFYHNFLQKNPETTRYLIKWLKQHPDIYLALADHRT